MLTQATAEKYFGDYKIAMGRTIKFNNDRIYKVTGIIQNPPANTDFQMRAIMSYATLKPDFCEAGPGLEISKLKPWIVHESSEGRKRIDADAPVEGFFEKIPATAKHL